MDDEPKNPQEERDSSLGDKARDFYDKAKKRAEDMGEGAKRESEEIKDRLKKDIDSIGNNPK